MTVLDAFREGTRRAREMKYAHETARAIEIIGADVFPYMTPDEMRRHQQGLCRDLAIYALDTAYHLAPEGRYALIIGDTDDPDAAPDHAWCEARAGDDVWWSDPTNTDVIEPPGWFSRLTPQRAYTFGLSAAGRLTVVAREDFA